MGMIHVTHFVIWEWSLQGVFSSKQHRGSISQTLVVPKSCCSGVLLLCDPSREMVCYKRRQRQKEKFVKDVGQVHLCMQLSGFRECMGQDNMDSQSLLTADHWQTWVDQPGLPEYFLSILAAANVTAGCLLPASSVKVEDVWSHLEKEDREWCFFSRRHVMVGDKTD